MNLSRKLPLLTSALVVALCLALAAVAIAGSSRMMAATERQVDQGLSDLVFEQMEQGVRREREQVLNLIDTARRQVVATARSQSALPALRADQDEQLRSQAIQPIAAGTLELGRTAQAQIDQLGRSLDTGLKMHCAASARADVRTDPAVDASSARGVAAEGWA